MAYNEHGLELPSPTAASATITVTTAADLGSGGYTSFQITTTTGVVITATGHGSITTSTDTNSPTFLVIGGANDATASFLQACLNANSHLVTTRDGAVVTITQVTPGASGNTTIVVTDPGDDGASVANFSGGEGEAWGFSRDVVSRTGDPYDEHAGDFTMNHFKNMTAHYKHKDIPQIPFSRAMIPIRDPRVVAAPLTSDNDVI